MAAAICAAPEVSCTSKTTSKTGLCTIHRAQAEQEAEDAARMEPAAGRFELVRVGKPYTRTAGWDRFRFYPVTEMHADGQIARMFEAVSVTTALDHSIPKPALVHWAASVERTFVLDQLVEVINTMSRAGIKVPKGADAGEFVRTQVQSKLGDRYAHRMKLNTAGVIGTQIHAWIEWHHLCTMGREHAGEPPLMDEAMNAVAAYLDLEKQFNVRPIATEERVASLDFGYAGALDTRAIATHPEHGDLRVIIDYKSGKAIYNEARQQVAAYGGAHNELCRLHDTPNDTTQAGLIFRLPKVVGDPMPEVSWVLDMDEQFEKFICTLAQYHSLIGDAPLRG